MSLSPTLATAAENATARLSLLQAWLSSLNLVQVDSARAASSDASFRRYLRVDVLPAAQATLGLTLIVMDAPPAHENVAAFVQVAGLLGATGVTVPNIIAHQLEHGFLLLADLGDTTYLDLLTPDTAPRMYADALDALIKIQRHSMPDVLPEYDRAVLLRELNLFPEWYIGRHLGLSLTPAQTTQLNGVFDALLANNLAQQQVYVHRDYHSRNLMVLSEGNPGILDFQDALYGPVTYDLASLLRDAYVQWDEELVLDCVVRYWQRAKQAGLPVNPDIDAFYRDFEFMALQRHLKILGIFTRLHQRDGKPAYLAELPRVLDYVRKTAGRYRELKPLVHLLDALENITPAIGYTF